MATSAVEKNIDTFAVRKCAYFIVAMSAAQSIVTATETKVLFDAVFNNQDGCFDVVTNHRWTPNVSGVVLGEGFIKFDSVTAGTICTVRIKKNGVLSYVTHQVAAANGDVWVSFPWRGTPNGTTDYYELFVEHDEGANIDVCSDGFSFFAGLVLPLTTS